MSDQSSPVVVTRQVNTPIPAVESTPIEDYGDYDNSADTCEMVYINPFSIIPDITLDFTVFYVVEYGLLLFAGILVIFFIIAKSKNKNACTCTHCHKTFNFKGFKPVRCPYCGKNLVEKCH